MVFSSVPVYLDPPNWNQQQQSHQPGSSGLSGGAEPHLLQPPVAPRPEGSGMAGSVRPGSMADRARLAKVPQPEPALKCPRCDSTNTKFCYFNNYSLSQPRHFCKTCRRYWTRGGALRNVPVGGGCRRTKRSKSGGSSKSPMNTAVDRQGGTSSVAAGTSSSAGGGTIHPNLQPPPQMPFMASFHSLADYGAAANIGLNFGGMQPIDASDYHVGSSSSVGLEQWRLQQQVHQFPFFAGLEPSSGPPPLGLYQFDGDMGVDGAVYAGQSHGKPSTSGLITQMASVKMEENPPALNLPRQYLSIPGNDQYWGDGGGTGGGGNGGGGWTDLSGFNSSSTGNIL